MVHCQIYTECNGVTRLYDARMCKQKIHRPRVNFVFRSQNCSKLMTSLRKDLLFATDTISFALHTAWFFSFFRQNLLLHCKQSRESPNEEKYCKYRAGLYIKSYLHKEVFLLSWDDQCALLVITCKTWGLRLCLSCVCTFPLTQSWCSAIITLNV